MGYLAAKLGRHQPNQAERERAVEALRSAILARCVPTKIWVFGSILTDHFTHASDIDCAVLFKSVTDLQQARRDLYRSPALIDLPYDLLLYVDSDFYRKSQEGGICQVINENGRIVYDQESKV